MKSARFDAREATVLYLKGEFDQLSDCFLEVLDYLDSHTLFRLTPPDSKFINSFAETFLYLFVKENYLISDHYLTRFIGRNPVVSNMTAISVFRNTDPQLEILKGQKGNFVKLLTLLSPRNSVTFDLKQFFDANRLLASIWYSIYYEAVEGYPTNIIYENMKRHQLSLDKRWMIAGATRGGACYPYFQATYVDHSTDRTIKSHINQCLKPMFNGVTISSCPDRKKIAIVTARWYPTSAVYRSCERFIASLCPDYDLTLIHLGKLREGIDNSLFSQVLNITFSQGKADLSAVQDNDFIMAYFPDIGMQAEDRYLCNLRFAPIQVAGYGHPVSTWGGEIDYFIGGADVEPPKGAENNFSERLVLIPGIACIPSYPSYRPEGIKRDDNRIIINCPWAAMKCNYSHFQTLLEIIRRSDKQVLFRFFSGWVLNRHNAFLAFAREVVEVLGQEHAEVTPFQPSYDEYMAILEQGDFTIDSWPYGGYTTTIDSLWLGKPVITREGGHYFNRASAALLKQAGLDELIGFSAEEFADLVVRMINDDPWRDALKSRIRGIDLENTLFDPEYTGYFRKAIDYLIEHHETLQQEKSRAPVIIKRSRKSSRKKSLPLTLKRAVDEPQSN